MRDPIGQQVFKELGGRCIHCLTRPAVAIHEIEPRGYSNRRSALEASNRAPLCAACHEWAQSNTGRSVPLLRHELNQARRRVGLAEFQYPARTP